MPTPNQKSSSRIPKITVIGGGTGVFTVLSGLKNYETELTAVISMADDGGSTGVLREEFGILPPGDARRAIIALSQTDNRLLSQLFNYRFEEGGLSGHTFGNIMLTALERMTGNFETALEEAGRILNMKGSVVPVTLNKIRLGAELENGEVIKGETNIDIPKHNPELKIKKIFLEPNARVNKRAVEKIALSDLIIIGPGDLYTSIIPNLIVSGIPQAIKNSGAKKAYVVNLMTKSGETNNFTADNFVASVEQYLGKNIIDYAIINNKQPSGRRLRIYSQENSRFVEPTVSFSQPIPILGDFLREKGFLRHDPQKLGKIIMSLI